MPECFRRPATTHGRRCPPFVAAVLTALSNPRESDRLAEPLRALSQRTTSRRLTWRGPCACSPREARVPTRKASCRPTSRPRFLIFGDFLATLSTGFGLAKPDLMSRPRSTESKVRGSNPLGRVRKDPQTGVFSCSWTPPADSLSPIFVSGRGRCCPAFVGAPCRDLLLSPRP